MIVSVNDCDKYIKGATGLLINCATVTLESLNSNYIYKGEKFFLGALKLYKLPNKVEVILNLIGKRSTNKLYLYILQHC